MISQKYKCIQVHIPKCAGTSIAMTITNKDGVEWDSVNKLWKQHATISEIRKLYCNEFEFKTFFKFAFVRNPFDRIVSSYNFLCRNRNIPVNKKHFKIL